MPAKFPFDPAPFLPFRDKKALERVRNIKKKDICKHPNKNFKIRLIEDQAAFGFAYVLDIVAGIQRALDEGRRHVIILPAPNPQYAFVAEMINRLRIPCKHVHTFNMDEYADQDGNTAPREWKGGFQYWMWNDLFSRIDPKLRIPEKQVHFPSTKNVSCYSRMLEDLGGADVCYGGIGWAGHIAFFEPHLGEEFGDDVDAYLEEGARIVDLHPVTVCQNSLFCDCSCSGDLANCPPKAATIGPRDLKNSKLVSFWDGFTYGDVSWQRFITRLAAHGPVTPMVPASILQVLRSQLTISGAIAADCVTEVGERRTAIEFPK
jgi:glucosamine-6-phosphate deaminase